MRVIGLKVDQIKCWRESINNNRYLMMRNETLNPMAGFRRKPYYRSFLNRTGWMTADRRSALNSFFFNPCCHRKDCEFPVVRRWGWLWRFCRYLRGEGAINWRKISRFFYVYRLYRSSVSDAGEDIFPNWNKLRMI